MVKFTRPFLARVSKAKAAKLVRHLVDQFLDMEAGTGKEVNRNLIQPYCILFEHLINNARP